MSRLHSHQMAFSLTGAAHAAGDLTPTAGDSVYVCDGRTSPGLSDNTSTNDQSYGSEGTMKLSRAALYELVWSQPMTQIARFYGVRDLKIAQACDFYDIARPTSGYWQKLAHGKKVEKIGLQTTTYSKSDIVTIESSGATKRPHRAQGKAKNPRKEDKQDQSLWHKRAGL